MRSKLLATTALAGMLLAMPAAKAQFAVFDAANFQQNVQQTLQQITELIRPGFRLNILVNKDMLFPEPYEGA